MNAILQSSKVNKTYRIDAGNAHQVLFDVDLSICPGEFVAVMGPSGSGKSTLLYNLCGLDRFNSGSVTFDGQRLESMKEPALARLRLTDMGFVFQDVHLLQNLSLLDNVLLSGFLSRQRPRREVVERARELLDRTGLSGMETRGITQASGGQLQRVGICRALINEPKIVFGDEPTGALNSQASKEIMDLLTEVNRRGTTVVLVTHDARVAARAGRVLLMMDGRIVSEQNPGAMPTNDSDAIDLREARLTEWLREKGV